MTLPNFITTGATRSSIALNLLPSKRAQRGEVSTPGSSPTGTLPGGVNSVTTHWKCQKVGGYISFLVSVWRLDFLIVVFSSAVYFAHSEKKSVLVHCWGLIDELQNYTSQKHVFAI